MPDSLRGIPNDDRGAAAEALTHYLVSLAPGPFTRTMPDRAAVLRGEALYHRVGCVACHAPQNGVVLVGSSVPLPQMADKWSFDGLRKFLLDPLATRPSGRMPSMNLSEREASDIAHYLLRGNKVAAPLEITQYRGRIRALDDLDSAEMARTGPVTGFSLDPLGKDRGFALRFTGWLAIEKAGDYTFYLKAAGAGRLSVDGDWYLGDDSWEREEVDDKIKLHLGEGRHELRVDYVHRGPKDPSLAIEWSGPGFERQMIPSAKMSSAQEPVDPSPEFIVDAVKAAKGRDLYSSLHCSACHGRPVHPENLPSLAKLRLDQGCLAEVLPAGVPNFHFSASNRSEIRAALVELNAPTLELPTPKRRLANTIESLNCIACHVRDGVGGIKPVRDAYFTSNGEDLGDEGRIPPRLDGVGDKLRPDWLSKVLTNAASVRPYLNTRMPQFGVANVRELPRLFEEIDQNAPFIKASADSSEDLIEAGRKLTGTGGLSCIACHKFNRQPAHALQVIDLITAPQRLNHEWFRAFLLDPNRFHPGTRMPAFWPEGSNPMPAVLGGDTSRQFLALWTYFSQGSLAKFPEGLSRQNMELIVGGDPVVYRGKLWEAGFRAIAVGYPGQVNVAFDAEEMRLSLLWTGRFLNAGPHWSVQGMGQIRPLGAKIAIFPHGSPLANLTNANQPWPTASSKALGMKFRGYQLDTMKRPTFLYSFRDLQVEDFSIETIIDGKSALHRSVKFLNVSPTDLYIRLAGGGPCVPAGPNAWRINDIVTITLAGDGKAFVRGKGEKQELLLPVGNSGANHELEIDYVW